MNIEVGQLIAAFTANGTAQGYVTVTSSTGFLPGAICGLSDNAGRGMTVMITDVPSATLIGVRQVAQPAIYPQPTGLDFGSGMTGPAQTLTENMTANYGRTNISAFLTANSATITQYAGIVRVEPSSQVAPRL